MLCAGLPRGERNEIGNTLLNYLVAKVSKSQVTPCKALERIMEETLGVRNSALSKLYVDMCTNVKGTGAISQPCNLTMLEVHLPHGKAALINYLGTCGGGWWSSNQMAKNGNYHPH